MTIDTTAPRSRRALLFGAIGGALASVGILSKPQPALAGTDGDVVLDATNTAAGTTVIDGAIPNVLEVTGSGTAIVGVGASGIDPLSNFPVGVYGSASGAGVLGQTADGMGVFGHSDTVDGVYGQGFGGNHPDHNPSVGVHGVGDVGVVGSAGPLVTQLPDPIDASTGVYGTSETGHGVYGASDTGIGVYAANNSATKGAIVAEGGPGTAIHGHANAGPVPSSPGLTGIYGSATGAGVAIAADSASGLAIRATSSAGHAIRGRGQLDGVIGESPGARSGVVGYSGAGSAPAGPGKTGVYGEATQDTASRGVSGFSLAGQGVRGEATTGQGVQGTATTGHGVHGDATANGTGVMGYSGALPAPTPPLKTGVYGEANQDSTARGVSGKTTIGQAVRADATSGIAVRAVATTGYALFASGKVKMDRSGLAKIPANQSYVDVAVPGGTSASALAFASLQIKRAGVYVVAARPAYPSATQMRIYLNKVASTSATTPVAWMVLS